MYKELHIEYVSPKTEVIPLILRYKLNDFPIVKRWTERLATALELNIPIDDPARFYGFNDIETEKLRAVTAINKCCETIDNYSPGMVGRRVDLKNIDQDTLNYLHNIFEVYHGTLNTPHEFFNNAPDEVKKALAQLNVEVHRCEGLAEGTVRKQLPTHMVTYYGLPKNTEFTLELEDYQHFTDMFEFGTVYLLYTEIGKTLQDMAIDNDHHMQPTAYKPFRHYSADFVVRMFGLSHQTWVSMRKLYKKHYDENEAYYLNHGYDYSHPFNRPGNIPLAKLIPTPINVIEELAKRQYVKSVKLV
jgi:hypothetical protein